MAGKWKGGIRDMVLDCPVEPAWDLFSDWGNSEAWYSPIDSCELLEGENRKPGCVRLIKYPDMWLQTRILEIDNEKHVLSYSIDATNMLGGFKGFVGSTKFRETSDGKTLVPYWKFEVNPVENQSPETFSAFIDKAFKTILTELERGAQKVAAGLDPKPVK